MLFKLKVLDQNVCNFSFFFNSDKSIFAVILSIVTAVYFAGTRKKFKYSCRIKYCIYVF